MQIREIIKYYVAILFLSIIIPCLLMAGNKFIFGEYQLKIILFTLFKIILLNSVNFIYLFKKVNRYIIAFFASFLFQILAYIYFEKLTHSAQGYDFSYIYPTFVSAFNVGFNLLLILFYLSKKIQINNDDYEKK